MSAADAPLPLPQSRVSSEAASSDAERATPIVGAGGHWVLQHGDALAVLRSMPDASVDAVITDPPYSSGGFTRGDRSMPPAMKYTMNGTKIERPAFSGDNRDQRSFAYWCALWLGECLRVAKPGAPLCVFTDWRQLPTMTDAVQAGGWVWRGIVVWDKTEACRPAMGRFAAQCEYVVWGTAGPSRDDEEVGCLWGVIREPVRMADKHHVTGKPRVVMQQLVRICPPSGIVLDPFAGSGTTGVAALLEGRRFVGNEISAEYVGIARQRLEAAEANVDLEAYRAGQEPLFGPFWSHAPAVRGEPESR
jgi:site-specific DNA-methyltransferase (adenine-specific)